MKKIIYLSFLALCGASFGQNIPFRHLGSPFNQTNVDLVWAAPTNNLPRELWVYRAWPASVSTDTISNLVALGSFTDRDRKKSPDNPHLISYADPTDKRGLLINTDWAFIHYSDADANDMHVTNGVPGKQQAFEMATTWLPKLGVDSRQLYRNPQGATIKVYGGPDTVFFYAREGKGSALATNICMYDVTFKRALDGVEISGGSARGGCTVEFGHHARISSIIVSWRNYKRDKLYSVPTPEILLKWIREGKAVWYSPDFDVFDWSSIKKIVITKITPYYYSDAYGMNDNPQNWASPFAELEAKIEINQTNAIFYLDCPIIGETKP